MQWKVNYTPYERHGVSESRIEFIEGKDIREVMNKTLEFLGKEQSSDMKTLEDGSMEWEVEEVETWEDFEEIIVNEDGDDHINYIYDMTNRKFLFEN